jgi:alanyl-tRNA synthetase
MAGEGATGYTERIKKNEEKIKELEGQLKDHNENCVGKIKALEEEIERLKKEIKTFQLSEDQLCIAQLCTSLQKNMFEIVLEGYYDEKSNKNTKYMEDDIKNQIKDNAEQKRATERWELLKKEINWNPYWIRILGPLKTKRNEVAHPTLTEESIQRAKCKMKEEGTLSNNMVKAVDALTNMLKQTNYSKLQK